MTGGLVDEVGFVCASRLCVDRGFRRGWDRIEGNGPRLGLMVWVWFVSLL